jgi:hypothetical protein
MVPYYAGQSSCSRATTLKWWVGDWREDFVTTRLTAVKTSHHFRVVGLVGCVERAAWRDEYPPSASDDTLDPLETPRGG